MHTTKTIIAAGLLLLAPTAANAQSHIKAAFDKFLKNKNVSVVAPSHMLEKDPETGRKAAQADTYEFTLDKSKSALLRDIEQAFDADREDAYKVMTGIGGNSAYQSMQLAVGNDSSNPITLGSTPGSHYAYALFVDPDDADHQHRYAYAYEWMEADGKITGQLVVTYATMPKYRKPTLRMAVAMPERITINTDSILASVRNLQGTVSAHAMLSYEEAAKTFGPNSEQAERAAEIALIMLQKIPEAYDDSRKESLAKAAQQYLPETTNQTTRGFLTQILELVKK